jgi:hypothetical protein
MRLLINENYFNALKHDNFYIFVCIYAFLIPIHGKTQNNGSVATSSSVVISKTFYSLRNI